MLTRHWSLDPPLSACVALFICIPNSIAATSDNSLPCHSSLLNTKLINSLHCLVFSMTVFALSSCLFFTWCISNTLIIRTVPFSFPRLNILFEIFSTKYKNLSNLNLRHLLIEVWPKFRQALLRIN